MMVGGFKVLWEFFCLVFEVIVVKFEGDFCVVYFGFDGVGYFVKIVYNGIEYVDMQMIVEVYGLLWDGEGCKLFEIVLLFYCWNEGVLQSYLIEIIGKVLDGVDLEIGKLMIDLIVDQVG